MRSGNPGRTRGAPAFDQDNTNIPLRIDAIEAVANDFADGTVEFGSQFRSGSPSPDDRNVKLARSYRLGLRLSAKTGVDQTVIEALRLSWRFQLYSIFGNAGGSEVVRHAANRAITSVS